VIENVDFTDAYKNRVQVKIKQKGKDFNIFYIGLNDLIKNKKAINRYKDKEDLKFLKHLVNKK